MKINNYLDLPEAKIIIIIIISILWFCPSHNQWSILVERLAVVFIVVRRDVHTLPTFFPGLFEVLPL